MRIISHKQALLFPDPEGGASTDPRPLAPVVASTDQPAAVQGGEKKKR